MSDALMRAEFVKLNQTLETISETLKDIRKILVVIEGDFECFETPWWASLIRRKKKGG